MVNIYQSHLLQHAPVIWDITLHCLQICFLLSFHRSCFCVNLDDVEHIHYPAKHCLANFIMINALVPNRYQAISNHHDDSGVTIYKWHMNNLMQLVYHFILTKQTLFKRSQEGGNPSVSYLLTGSETCMSHYINQTSKVWERSGATFTNMDQL